VRSGNYKELEWLDVQEWLYTTGLTYAFISEGALDLINHLILMNSKIFIVSHKSKYSAKNKLDLITPVSMWLNEKLGQIQVFFEESRDKKIERIINLGITHFVDDLIEVFQEKKFPKSIKSFWFNPTFKNIDSTNIIQIKNISEVIKYV
jgi:hypothetical protein